MARHIPTFDELMIPILEIIKQKGGSATVTEINEQLIKELGLTGEMSDQFFEKANNGTSFYTRCSWARSYLKKGNLITNSQRCVWSLVSSEASLTKEDLPKLLRSVRSQINPHSSSQPDLVEKWKTLLLSILGSLSPKAFENLTQNLLKEAGFTKVKVTGRTNDHGIDGVGILKVNLISFHVAFQCKRYKGSIGSEALRSFRGSFHGRLDKGLFVTTGHFTAEAQNEATRDGAIAIDLIDGDRLCELLKQYNLGVSTKLVEEVTVDEKFFNKFDIPSPSLTV